MIEAVDLARIRRESAAHRLRREPTGDPRRLRMVYSLLFSLPGTPVLFYGEEIGMGEDLKLAGRESLRTPMQ